MKKMIVALLFLIIFPGQSIALDKSPIPNSQLPMQPVTLDQIDGAMITVVTRGQYVGRIPADPDATGMRRWRAGIGSGEQRGIGLVLGDFLITAGHVVTMDIVKIETSEYASIITPAIAPIYEEFLAIYRDKTIRLPSPVLSPLADLAVFPLPSGHGLPQFPLGLVDWRRIQTGDYIIAFGRPDQVFTILSGAIIVPYPSGNESDAAGRAKVLSPSGSFLMTARLVPGFSGGPIIGFDFGVPYLVGFGTALLLWGEFSAGVPAYTIIQFLDVVRTMPEASSMGENSGPS